MHIKKHPNYTDAIGQDLGIIGAEQVIDYNSLKPILILTLQAGHPNVGWLKQGMDGLEILVDRGDGKGFVFLAFDTIPDYLDTAPLPAPGTSAVWKYKAISRLADDRSASGATSPASALWVETVTIIQKLQKKAGTDLSAPAWSANKQIGSIESADRLFRRPPAASSA